MKLIGPSFVLGSTGKNPIITFGIIVISAPRLGFYENVLRPSSTQHRPIKHNFLKGRGYTQEQKRGGQSCFHGVS